MQQADTLLAQRVLQVQAILGSVAVVIALPFGYSVVVSVLIGAGVCLLANGLFAASVFRDYRAQHPDLLLLRIYGAEVAKLALIIGLFVVAFVTLDGLNIPALLAAYLVTQVAATLIAAQLETQSGDHDKNRHEKN